MSQPPRTMAELTPPSSRNNTPQRPSDPDPGEAIGDVRPSSPTISSIFSTAATGQPHPLSTRMDLDEETDDQSDSDIGQPDERMSESEDDAEAEAEVGAEEGDDGDGEKSGDREESGAGWMGNIASTAAGALGLTRKQSRTRTSKRKTKRSKRRVPAAVAGGTDTRTRTGTALAPNSSGASAGGGSRRDGELYEINIVTRWNNEMGDVCAIPTNVNPSPIAGGGSASEVPVHTSDLVGAATATAAAV